MQPSDLQPSALQNQSFAAYPPEARALVTKNLALLRQLPLPLLPLLLREIGSYDWRFPRERERVASQLASLAAMPQAQRSEITTPFAALTLPASLAALDWVNDAAGYMEQLTATLWSTGQMPAFRYAAKLYAEKVDVPATTSSIGRNRLVMVVLDTELGAPQQRGQLYQRLRREGVLFTHVDPANGMAALHDHIHERSRNGGSYAHWFIDGATVSKPLAPGVTTVSYGALEPTRQRLLERARNVMQSEKSGPEELRTLMSHLTPAQIGLDRNGEQDNDPVMAHFQLSLLTEGSGTQVFATTFVQWAARECLRRAEPQTVLARFTARQRQQGMNELLSGAPSTGLDLEGSLVDADQGAWYTWLNLQRLPGAATSRFLAWQQGQSTAVAVGPGLPRGTTSNSPTSIQQVLKLLA